MDNGAITQSRWGLKGAEALGNNLKAIFQLENGFNGPTAR
jgi:predicted porin